MFRQDGSCPALLEDLCPGFPYGAVTRCGTPFQTLLVPKTTATGLLRVRSPLLTESRLMSVPPVTEMFQFTGFASCTYEFSTGYPCGWVAPFGDPGITDRSHLPRAFRSVPRPSSPLSAKASTRCPCFALDHRTTAAHRAKPRASPRQRRAAVSHEDTSLGQSGQALLAPACPPRSHHNSLFTLQPTPPRSPAAVSLNLLRTSRAPLGRTRLAQRTGSISRCSPAAPVSRKTHALARLGFAGGGGERIRTDDLLLAKQALSQLSYTPAPGIRRPRTGHQSL